MLQTISKPKLAAEFRPFSDSACDVGFDDVSPFGLQGLSRESLRILKPECIGRLAQDLSLRGSPQQTQDSQFTAQRLERHPDWLEEYRVVHLIEKSLWIDGHSDLVMTMIKNPSQIPDNPPREIQAALAKAYQLHPDATIWYGIPLFSDQQNADGLPIPLTAAQVSSEAQRRMASAQQRAARWGWAYRTAAEIARIPSRCWQFGVGIHGGLVARRKRIADYFEQVRADSRRRIRAKILAGLEKNRCGRSKTIIPGHSTRLGRIVQGSLDTAYFFYQVIAENVDEQYQGVFGGEYPQGFESAFVFVIEQRAMQSEAAGLG